MTVAELLRVLVNLPRDAEVAILSHSGHARPPVIEKINPWAYINEGQASTRAQSGLDNPKNAYLIRPAQDVI